MGRVFSSLAFNGNNHSHLVSILFVDLQVCTLKCVKDATHMTYFKEALTRRQGC